MKKNDNLDSQCLVRILEQAPHPLRLDDILSRANLSRRLKGTVQEELRRLADSGRLLRLRGGVWAVAAALKTMTGILAVQRSGAAFVIPQQEAHGGSGRKKAHSGKAPQDVYVASGALGGAWNGDLVEVVLLPSKPGRHSEGRIVTVLRRAHSELTVRVAQSGNAAPRSRKERGGAGFYARPLAPGRVLARPADPRFDFDLLVDVSALEQAPEMDELLLVKVGEELESPFDIPLWAAAALASLGPEDSVRVQESLTKLNHRIPTSFPDDVLAEAGRVTLEHQNEEGLTDIRDLALVTIDGEDARDFDDAVFVERAGKNWRLLVAIADVSLYVRPRGKLDREAAERGNSCYFPASVEPMLPEALSNGVCSLRPGEDRRVMAADLELDAKGKPVRSRFYAANMRSRARLTYSGVQAFLDADAAAAADSAQRAGLDPALAPMLRQAAALAALLMERRKAQGSLDFAIPEAEFVVEGGRVIDLRNRARLFSHRLIEAFMVEANEAVAEFLRGKKQAFLYRTHPAPSPEKLETLVRSLRELNLDLPLPRGKVPAKAWLPATLRAAAATGRAWLVDSLALRSMMQARYAPEQDIHFGLASECYCHFTSPIRRYADLVVHRALRRALGLDSGGAIPAGTKLLAVAETCNTRERAAQDAEREITRRMGCLVLQGKEGEYFRGVISGVTHFGVFVQLEGKPLEGMIRVDSLGGDYYQFDQDRQELRGLRNGRSFRLGDRIEVLLSSVHVGRLEINLTLADGAWSGPGSGKAQRGGKIRGNGTKARSGAGRTTSPRRPRKTATRF